MPYGDLKSWTLALQMQMLQLLVECTACLVSELPLSLSLLRESSERERHATTRITPCGDLHISTYMHRPRQCWPQHWQDLYRYGKSTALGLNCRCSRASCTVAAAQPGTFEKWSGSATGSGTGRIWPQIYTRVWTRGVGEWSIQEQQPPSGESRARNQES
ncbi:hypothetical protein C8F01DRAFT_1130082 [Mycena amicta]|nr:hypothetical protein C8F01DRAFT_1130082 [Mycena amicta]